MFADHLQMFAACNKNDIVSSGGQSRAKIVTKLMGTIISTVARSASGS